MPGTCANCGKHRAAKKCSRCSSVWYCDGACQKSDWRTHKGSCRTYPEGLVNQVTPSPLGSVAAAVQAGVHPGIVHLDEYGKASSVGSVEDPFTATSSATPPAPPLPCTRMVVNEEDKANMSHPSVQLAMLVREASVMGEGQCDAATLARVTTLIRSGADPTVCIDFARSKQSLKSVLTYAAIGNDAAMVEKISTSTTRKKALRWGLNCIDRAGLGEGLSPLCTSARSGHLEVMEALVALGAHPDGVVSATRFQGEENASTIIATPLQYLVGTGIGTRRDPLPAIQLLLKLGANPNAVNSVGKTVLYAAMSRSGDEALVCRMVCELLKSDADPNLLCSAPSDSLHPLMGLVNALANSGSDSEGLGVEGVDDVAREGDTWQKIMLQELLRHGCNFQPVVPLATAFRTNAPATSLTFPTDYLCKAVMLERGLTLVEFAIREGRASVEHRETPPPHASLLCKAVKVACKKPGHMSMVRLLLSLGADPSTGGAEYVSSVMRSTALILDKCGPHLKELLGLLKMQGEQADKEQARKDALPQVHQLAEPASDPVLAQQDEEQVAEPVSAPVAVAPVVAEVAPQVQEQVAEPTSDPVEVKRARQEAEAVLAMMPLVVGAEQVKAAAARLPVAPSPSCCIIC